MPQIIARNIQNNRRYLVIGTGFGEWQSSRDGMLHGLLPVTEHGDSRMICVSDRSGTIGWLKTDDVVIETVDGRPIAELPIDEAEDSDSGE